MKRQWQQWSIRLIALVIGAVAFLAISEYGLEAVKLVYDKVGITVIALLPLTVWGLWTALREDAHKDMTLSYIGTTAQRVGLLGTVIGIVAATVRIGDSLNTGAAGAVTGALPAVGQALISTAVGFVVAITCDFFRYIQERGETVEIQNEAREHKEEVV